METKERAVALHGEGYNCAQCVLLACGEYTGLDEKTAIAVSAPFGGGMRCGEMCGAVSGGLMAVGLNRGAAKKDAVAAMAKRLSAEFKERMGCLRCQDLKRAGVSCDSCIACGAEIAEKIIKDNG